MTTAPNTVRLRSVRWAMFSKEHGFTLIECVITLMLLGVLAAVSLSVVSAFKLRAEQSTLVQTDIYTASSCMERIKAIAKSDELLDYKGKTDLACANATIKFTALQLTPKDIHENDTNLTVRVEPADDPDATDAPYYLVTVTAGSAQFSHVVSGRKNP